VLATAAAARATPRASCAPAGGRLALTRSAVFSECTDHFSDNDVLGDASGSARRRVGEPRR
jgi:hypothetical protein